MYFVIQNGTIEASDNKSWQESQDAISVFTSIEWQEQAEFRNTYNLNIMQEKIHFCKLESFSEYLFGTMSIPVKKNYTKHIGFEFFILEGRIVFIDDTNIVNDIIKKIAAYKRKREYSMERFFFDFLVSFIEDDLHYLELFEHEISKVEEDILNANYNEFNYKMLSIKKEISRMYRYYSQLTALGEALSENEMDFFGKDEIATFRVFTERSSRLQFEAQLLREYAMQVQEVYQSEISIRQNDVMKVLTIVTMIFLPLTLIVGWFGMNFEYMPELGWKYSYPLVIVFCIFVVILCLWIFKKKRFW